MIVLTQNKILNMDSVKYTELRTKGMISEDPCIAFVLEFGNYEYGDYLDRRLEVSFPDFPTAQEYFETFQEAVSDGLAVFDMR